MTDNIVIPPALSNNFIEKSCLVFPQYVAIQNEYLTKFTQSSKYLKPAGDNQYLLVNGLITLTHVFNIICQHILNPELALGNMQRAIYYYIPFIEQIEDNILYDLNISSNSASIFVYKKTIGLMTLSEIQILNEKERDFISSMEELIFIHRKLFELLLSKKLPINEIVEKLKKFFNELCSETKYTDEKVFKKKLLNITLLIKQLIGGFTPTPPILSNILS